MSIIKNPFKIYNYGSKELLDNTNVVYIEGKEQDYLDLKEEHIGKEFEDPEFPRNESSIGFDYTKPGSKLEGYYETLGWDRKKVEWDRFKNLYPSSKAIFCSKATDPNKQLSESAFRLSYDPASIGNCWFLSALTVVSSNPYDIDFVVPPDNFDEANLNSGIYHFRFWYQGYWVDIVVDDYVPFIRTKPDEIFLLGANSIANGDEKEFWMVLAVKAFAKLVGNYARVLQGSPKYSAYEFLTGGFCQTLELDPKLDVESDNATQIWDDLFFCLGGSNRNIIIALSSSLEKKEFTKEDQEDFGLQNEHSYTLVRMGDINNIKIVKLRNPVYAKDSKGEQRFDKDEVDHKGGSFWTNIDKGQITKLGLEPSNPGEFLMSYKDALKCFHKIFICSQLSFHQSIRGLNHYEFEAFEGKFGSFKPCFDITIAEADNIILTIGLTLKSKIYDVPDFPIDIQLFPAEEYINTISRNNNLLNKIVQIPSKTIECAYKFLCCRGPDEVTSTFIGIKPTVGSRNQVQQGNKSISFLYTDLKPGIYIVAPRFLNGGSFNEKFILKLFYPKPSEEPKSQIIN